jgi:hypothetical protein
MKNVHCHFSSYQFELVAGSGKVWHTKCISLLILIVTKVLKKLCILKAITKKPVNCVIPLFLLILIQF